MILFVFDLSKKDKKHCDYIYRHTCCDTLNSGGNKKTESDKIMIIFKCAVPYSEE